MSQFGCGRWYNAFDRSSGLGDVEDHPIQVVTPLDEGEEWLQERVIFPRDSLVGIFEEALVPNSFQSDHVVLC